MPKKLFLPAAAIILALIIAVLVMAFAPQQNGLIVEGVLIDAGQNSPAEAFSGFSSHSIFLVSTRMNERMTVLDHSLFNGMALFLQVFEGNGKKAVQVIRVYDSQNNLSYCLTNFGDVNRSETLESGECLDYLSPQNGSIVMIELPDDGLQRPVIELNENALIVRPTGNEDIGSTSFLALRLMFKNAPEIIERSNQILGRISN